MSEDSPQPRYNEAARYAFKHIYPEGFLRFLVTAAFARWKCTGWVDSQVVSFPGDPERRCDTVAEFERLDGDRMPVALVVEFETAPASDTYPREGEYCLRLRREVPFHARPGVPYDVVGAIVFLTGPRQPTVWRMKPDDFCGLGTVMECAVPCFRDLNVLEALAKVGTGDLSPALLPFAPLIGGAETAEAATACRDAIKRETNEQVRKDMAAVALVLANLNSNPAAWVAAFQELKMEIDTSPLLLEYIRKGEIKGEARGEAKGALRRALQKTLEQCAGGSVPEDVRKRIEAQEDLTTLSDWCAGAFRCATWDKARELIGAP